MFAYTFLQSVHLFHQQQICAHQQCLMGSALMTAALAVHDMHASATERTPGSTVRQRRLGAVRQERKQLQW